MSVHGATSGCSGGKSLGDKTRGDLDAVESRASIGVDIYIRVGGRRGRNGGAKTNGLPKPRVINGQAAQGES